MNRAALVATLLIPLLAAQLPPASAQSSPPPASPAPAASGSPVASPSPTPTPAPTATPDLENEGPRDQAQRIEIFQDRRLIYDFNKEAKAYSLRQGPDPIYDVDFIELMQDPGLEKFWLGERNKDWALWLTQGLVLVPAGLVLFFQNFQVGATPGPLAFFADPTRSQADNVSDPRTFTLSLAGVAVAVWGAYNLGQWVGEELDQYHPNRLDEEAILPRVHTFNEDLRDRLGLEPTDLPSPPTPRPSVSPTPALSPTPKGLFGQPPIPSPPADLEDEATATAVPTPWPILAPGEALSPRPLVGPGSPRPSAFMFPGPDGRVRVSPRPEPSRKPKPKPKATPTPKPSPVAYPGTEP